MPTINLAATKAELLRELDSAVTLRDQLQRVTARNTRGGLAKSYVDQAIGLGFVGMVDAWESFLEITLIKYFAGGRSTLAPHPVVHPFLAPRGLDQARALLYQLNKSPRFLSLGYYSDVKSIADSIFSSNSPYDTLNVHQLRIEHGKKIRNRIAHAGQDASERFKMTARAHLGLAANAALPKGYNPGRLLVSPANVNLFAAPAGRPFGATVFDEFDHLYREWADLIVP